MSAGTLTVPRRADSIFADGLRMMREKFAIYAAFAAICAFAAWLALPRIDMYDVLARRPAALVTTPPVSVALLLSVAALFFVLPCAVRRIRPTFTMTTWRAAVTLVTIVVVATATELGYAFAVVPGIVAAVLLSQALIGALVTAPERPRSADVRGTIARAARASVRLTRAHFVTTLGVVALSLLILLVPFMLALLGLAILGVTAPPSLVLTTPLLFMTFVYFECVRYALIVRWYAKLSAEEHPASST